MYVCVCADSGISARTHSLDLRPCADDKALEEQGCRAEPDLWVEPGVDEPRTEQRGAFFFRVHLGKDLGLAYATASSFLVVGCLLAGRKVQAAVLVSGHRLGMGGSVNFECLHCS